MITTVVADVYDARGKNIGNLLSLMIEFGPIMGELGPTSTIFRVAFCRP